MVDVVSPARRFGEHGFLHLRDLVPRDLVERAYHRAVDIAAEEGLVTEQAGRIRLTTRCQRLSTKDRRTFARRLVRTREYEQIMSSPQLGSALSEIFSPAWTFFRDAYACWARFSLPRQFDRGQPPHQDWTPGLEAKLAIVWIPLSDCPKRLGGLGVLPDTHRHGLFARDEHGGLPISLRQPGWFYPRYERGDAMILDARTVHATMPNRTDRPRLSIDFRVHQVGAA
jgi:ectoine hydroxylase-related dioxygenase (phytanoyl-CoA dioxygenase family)